MNEQERALAPEPAMKLYAHLRENRPRGYSLGELGAEFKVDVARAHLHLSRLVDADLVELAWRGTTVTYAFKADPDSHNERSST